MSTVLLALAAAAAFAAATVAQHRGATEAAGDPDGGLVRRLLRQRIWLASQVGSVAGVLLQAAALRGGRLVVVQPLLSSGLVLSLVFAVLVDRRHPGRPLPDRIQWAGALAVAVGLSVFLLAAAPDRGVVGAPFGTTTICAAVALAGAGAAIRYGRDPGRRHRAFVFGAATGLGYGVAGLLLKQFVGSTFTQWPAWVTLAEFGLVGTVAVLVAQWGYQAGPLVESLPVAVVLEPVLAVALSGPLFAEYLAPGALHRGGQLLGAGTLVVGIVVLARRTAQREQPAFAAPAVAPPHSGTPTSGRDGGRTSRAAQSAEMLRPEGPRRSPSRRRLLPGSPESRSGRSGRDMEPQYGRILRP
jgi:hypothetical protein